MDPVRLGEIVAALGGELHGDAQRVIERIGPLGSAGPTTLSFLAQPRYRAQLADTKAACVIVAAALREAVGAPAAVIVAPDPYLYYARLTRWWAGRDRSAAPAGVHASAVVDARARLGAGVSVGPLAVIEADAFVGEGAVIGAQCFIGRAAHVGAGTRLAPRVSLGPGCRIGARGIVHGGVVIGADGFGFAPHEGRWEKIEQLGAVDIGEDVEIGANSCIDRGALEDTVIAEGVKIDNLVQVGHNVRIGAHSALAGCVGIAGSAVIGAHCGIGAAAVILGHLELVDHVQISACTVVSRSIRKPGRYGGPFPFDEQASWEKNAATLRQLHALRERLRTLEKKLS